MTFISGKKGDQWQVDSTLKDMARSLVIQYEDHIGHVDVDRVIFLRVIGNTGKWLGKCFPIKQPNTIITKYVLAEVSKMFNLSFDMESLESLADLRYIIAINEDKVEETGPNFAKVLETTLLHELKHVGKDMEGVNKHDSEDFKFILADRGIYWDEGIFDEDRVSNDLYSMDMESEEERDYRLPNLED